MNKRDHVRYDAELLPGSLSKVTISWEGRPAFDSYVVNCCPQGINVLIPPMQSPTDLPKEKDSVNVLMPIDQMWFTGECVYVRSDSTGSVSMGINFNDPKEQAYLKDLLFKSLNVPSNVHAFVSYEWEEMVSKLCASEDPQLQDIGNHHLADIKAKQNGPHWSDLMTERHSGQ